MPREPAWWNMRHGFRLKAGMTAFLAYQVPYILALSYRQSAGATKSTVTGAIPDDGLVKHGGCEIGPQNVGEKHLAVGKLPKHEIADARLAASANQQVRVWRVGQTEVGGDAGFVHRVNRLAGVGRLP